MKRVGFILLLVLGLSVTILACARTGQVPSAPVRETVQVVVTSPPQVITVPPQVVTAVPQTGEAAATPAAATTTTAPALQPGGTLRFGKAQEAVGLDPHLVTGIPSRTLTALVYQRLVDLDKDGHAVPVLAESWENPDPQTYTFKLRKGVKFHNGRELKASDVKYSFERILNPDSKSPWASRISFIDSIETPDDYTVTFHLKTPFGPFLSTISLDWASIVPREVVEEFGDLQANMVGTGPFQLTQYTQNSQTVLAAFPDYWGDKPLVDGVTFVIIPDESSRLAALRTGEIDVAQLSDPLAVGMASRTEGIEVVSQQTTDYYMLGFNVRNKPFDDIRVRQAVALALDRQGILDTVVFGDAQLDGVLPPTLGDWAIPASDLPHFKQNVEKAKQLLAEAGHPDGFEFTVLASPQFQQFPAIGLAIQSQLKNVGITMNVDQIEWTSFLSRWRERDFESFISYQAGGSDPDDALYGYFRGESGTNAVGLNDERVNTLLDQGRATVDRAERLKIYNELQQALDEQVPDLFLFTRTEYLAHRDNVQGLYLTPFNTFMYPFLSQVSVQ